MILEIPPLRERRGDITLLANFFVKRFAADLNSEVKSLTPEALQYLESYSWPGNVRELENTIERAMIFAEEGPLTPECLMMSSDNAADRTVDPNDSQSLPEIAAIALREAEMAAILRTLGETGGNKSKAAKLLGVSYKTLLNKIKDYEIGSEQAEA